ncbi:hypothetical protein [Bacillus cereus]|uniref:Uncharacterized protein n=1 Tax=Bacillus cereus TaxID=1396 RepID=A0ABD4LMT4_BACCE|nr:hypothetical protein [Bacillus cereus]MBK1611830.1 hypothetical protein [Bacillus cereus]
MVTGVSFVGNMLTNVLVRMMKMKLPEHKASFLKSVGFKQTIESEPRLSMIDKIVSMEKWELTNIYNHYQLYIHFIENEPAYCNLYSGELDDAEVFSERNLVSQMKKRGFNNDKN